MVKNLRVNDPRSLSSDPIHGICLLPGILPPWKNSIFGRHLSRLSTDECASLAYLRSSHLGRMPSISGLSHSMPLPETKPDCSRPFAGADPRLSFTPSWVNVGRGSIPLQETSAQSALRVRTFTLRLRDEFPRGHQPIDPPPRRPRAVLIVVFACPKTETPDCIKI